MIGIDWSSRERIIPAIHSRLVFQDRLATELIITAILLWYFFQLAVLFISRDMGLVKWMFTTESFPALSPGLVLAIISHAYPPRVTHLFGNIAFLWLFAGESEQHMGTLEVSVFFVVTAQVSVLTGTAISGGSTMGSSGGVLAFLGFYCIHMVLEHRNEFELETLESKGLSNTSLRTYWGLALLLTPIVLVPYMVGQHVGFISAGRTDVIGHLTGFLCGVGYAVVRSMIREN